MADLDRDLRELLRERAEEVRLSPHVPEPVLSRARRRRVRTTLIATATTLAMVVGGGAVASVLLPGEGGETPAAPADEWPGTWPYRTRGEAENAQAAADRGDPGTAWLLDPEAFVTRYAVQLLGWPGGVAQVDDPPDIHPDEAGPVEVEVHACPPRAPTREGGGYDDCELHVLVTIERLVRADRTGIWLVTGATDIGAGSRAPWKGIWPHATRKDAVAAQRRARAGDPEAAWLLESEQVVERYAREVLGWKTVTSAAPWSVGSGAFHGGLPPPPRIYAITNCPRTMACKVADRAEVTVESLVRRLSHFGIWTVTDVTTEKAVTGR